MEGMTIEGGAVRADGRRRARRVVGRRLGVVGAVLALLGPVTMAGVGDEDAPAADRGETANSRLDEVSAAKQRAYDLEGDERERALLEVAASYGAVADDDAHPVGDRAEAAFRAGEILRSRRRADQARRRFEQATAFGADGTDERAMEFAARGLLELAHLRRRASDVEGALGLYSEVGERFSDQARSNAHATTWRGKLLVREGRLDEARALYVGFAASFPDYPLEAVRNMDLLAVAFAEDGRLEDAHEVVALLRSQMEPVIAAGGRTAEAVHHSLSSLRVNVRLSGYTPPSGG